MPPTTGCGCLHAVGCWAPGGGLWAVDSGKMGSRRSKVDTGQNGLVNSGWTLVGLSLSVGAPS